MMPQKALLAHVDETVCVRPCVFPLEFHCLVLLHVVQQRGVMFFTDILWWMQCRREEREWLGQMCWTRRQGPLRRAASRRQAREGLLRPWFAPSQVGLDDQL